MLLLELLPGAPRAVTPMARGGGVARCGVSPCVTPWGGRGHPEGPAVPVFACSKLFPAHNCSFGGGGAGVAGALLSPPCPHGSAGVQRCRPTLSPFPVRPRRDPRLGQGSAQPEFIWKAKSEQAMGITGGLRECLAGWGELGADGQGRARSEGRSWSTASWRGAARRQAGGRAGGRARAQPHHSAALPSPGAENP